MTLRLLLLIAAIFCAVVLTITGFDWYHVDNPYQAGWLGLALVFYFAREVDG